MSMISNDRFPDVPMATQGVNTWHNQNLGDPIETADGIQHGQNQITLGPNGGMSWQRARPSDSGTFHETGTAYPGNTGAGYTVAQ